MALTNEQLVMLNALGYYSEFSDDYIPIFDDQSKTYKYKTIENFVADAGQYTTCFDDTLGLKDEGLGMLEILEHVKHDEQQEAYCANVFCILTSPPAYGIVYMISLHCTTFLIECIFYSTN